MVWALMGGAFGMVEKWELTTTHARRRHGYIFRSSTMRIINSPKKVFRISTVVSLYS